MFEKQESNRNCGTGNILQKPQTGRPKFSTFSKEDIYVLKCVDCRYLYIGLTGSILQILYTEHSPITKYV
jgi:hypothetical protein